MAKKFKKDDKLKVKDVLEVTCWLGHYHPGDCHWDCLHDR